jgi:hypothetical protein
MAAHYFRRKIPPRGKPPGKPLLTLILLLRRQGKPLPKGRCGTRMRRDQAEKKRHEN